MVRHTMTVPNEHLNMRTLTPTEGRPVVFQGPDTGGGEHWAIYTHRHGLHLYSILKDKSQEQEAGSQQFSLLVEVLQSLSA